MAKPRSRRAGESRYGGALPDRIRHARRLALLSQSGLAERLGVVPSAVAQWEGRNGTTPTLLHLANIATATGVAFEWLATGRGGVRTAPAEAPALDGETFAQDTVEERLLLAFRRLPLRKRESLVDWLERFV